MSRVYKVSQENFSTCIFSLRVRHTTRFPRTLLGEKKKRKRGGNQEMHVIKCYRDTSVVSTACTRPTALLLLSFHRLSFQCLLSRGRHAYSEHAILPKSLDSTQPVRCATRVAIICAISVPGKCRG